VAVIRADVSKELITSIIRVRRINVLGTLGVTSKKGTLLADFSHPDVGGDMFLRIPVLRRAHDETSQNMAFSTQIL
jgi:hypothetical protein